MATLPTLKPGDSSAFVNELQRLLVRIAAWPADWWGRFDPNVYGPLTQQSVRKFQAAMGLPANAIVDGQTWAFLYAKADENESARAAAVSAGTAAGTAAAEALAAQARANQMMLQPTTSAGLVPPKRLKPVSPVVVKLVLFAGIAGVAYYAYRKMAKRHSVDGIAFVDDGDDGSGPAIRAKRKRAPRRSRLAAAREPSESEGLKTLNPKAKHGRKVWRTKQDEDTWEWEEIDPGPNPSVPYRLEADERLFKSQKRYREDMRERAWDRVRANGHPVDVVVRGTKRVLYSARP